MISAMTQLEVALRSRLEQDLKRYDHWKGLRQMLGPAEQFKVLNPETVKRVLRWSELRNAVVHKRIAILHNVGYMLAGLPFSCLGKPST